MIRADRIAVAVPRATFSTEKKHVPNEFFDEQAEKEKEILDFASSLNEGGLENLTTIQDPLTWEKINAARTSTVEITSNSEEDVAQNEKLLEDLPEDIALSKRGKLLSSVFTNKDVGQHAKSFRASFVPAEMLNYNLPWRKSDKIPEPLLTNFIPHTSSERFNHNAQGLRACPGKLQRKGKAGVLGCHKIDLDELNHMDIFTLRKFISEDSEILGRKMTGLCAKCQRQVAKTIKRARNFGILPHIGDYEVQEVRPYVKQENFHDVVNVDKVINSKTIL